MQLLIESLHRVKSQFFYNSNNFFAFLSSHRKRKAYSKRIISISMVCYGCKCVAGVAEMTLHLS